MLHENSQKNRSAHLASIHRAPQAHLSVPLKICSFQCENRGNSERDPLAVFLRNQSQTREQQMSFRAIKIDK